MTSLNNEDVCRKSSVYNQTGQSYFQQLTAYNHMCAHLRHLLLAPSVVDSRNKKYTREHKKYREQLGSTRSGRSNSLGKVFQPRRNFIEELAYDTRHHPIDVLRMSFKSNSGHLSKENRDSARVCNACCCQGRREQYVTPAETVGKRRINLPLRIHKFAGGSRERSQSPAGQSPRNNAEPRYSYEIQCECHDDTNTEFGSPIVSTSESPSSRRNPNESFDALENKYSSRIERQAEEAKYARFIYDITQEIIVNGLYTDRELQGIFDKHFDMNSDTLDKDMMRSEIHQLRMSLNLTERSDDEEEDIERVVASAKFANFPPNKPPSLSKILERNKIFDKTPFDETRRRSRNSHTGNNTVPLVDASPELFITERDVLVTPMKMKLDPHQVPIISKSLRNMSRDTALSKTMQVDVETCYSRKREDRANSPIIWQSETRSNQCFHPSEGRLGDRRDEKTVDRRDRTAIRKPQHCQCQCRQDTYSARTVDYVQTRDIESAPKVERELQREQDRSEVALFERSKISRTRLPASKDKQNRQSDKHNSTFVSKLNEDEDEKPRKALDETVLSETELSTKANYIDSSLAHISERSERTARDTGADDTVTSNSEYTKIEQQTTNDEQGSLSECSSQTDEALVVQELMQLSEAEQVKVLDNERQQKAESRENGTDVNESPKNNGNNMELNEPSSSTEDLTIVTE